MQREIAIAPVYGTGAVFVGRERELAELTAILAALPEGRGGAALLAGEAGIGKTKLADEAARHAAAAGARVCWGHGWDAGGAPAYWPWVQVMRALARTVDDATWCTWAGDAAP
ncbi:MAG: AAA family ATPase, partial [bacterium]